jgi:hypothetical protein
MFEDTSLLGRDMISEFSQYLENKQSLPPSVSDGTGILPHGSLLGKGFSMMDKAFLRPHRMIPAYYFMKLIRQRIARRGLLSIM